VTLALTRTTPGRVNDSGVSSEAAVTLRTNTKGAMDVGDKERSERVRGGIETEEDDHTEAARETACEWNKENQSPVIQTRSNTKKQTIQINGMVTTETATPEEIGSVKSSILSPSSGSLQTECKSGSDRERDSNCNLESDSSSRTPAACNRHTTLTVSCVLMQRQALDSDHRPAYNARTSSWATQGSSREKETKEARFSTATAVGVPPVLPHTVSVGKKADLDAQFANNNENPAALKSKRIALNQERNSDLDASAAKPWTPYPQKNNFTEVEMVLGTTEAKMATVTSAPTTPDATRDAAKLPPGGEQMTPPNTGSVIACTARVQPNTSALASSRAKPSVAVQESAMVATGNARRNPDGARQKEQSHVAGLSTSNTVTTTACRRLKGRQQAGSSTPDANAPFVSTATHPTGELATQDAVALPVRRRPEGQSVRRKQVKLTDSCFIRFRLSQ
jgi:hypothetical protein